MTTLFLFLPQFRFPSFLAPLVLSVLTYFVNVSPGSFDVVDSILELPYVLDCLCRDFILFRVLLNHLVIFHRSDNLTTNWNILFVNRFSSNLTRCPQDISLCFLIVSVISSVYLQMLSSILMNVSSRKKLHQKTQHAGKFGACYYQISRYPKLRPRQHHNTIILTQFY